MKNIFSLLRFIALTALIVFSLTAALCDGGSNSGKSGGALVGKWYDTQEKADEAAKAIAAGIGFTNKEILEIGFSKLPDGWQNVSAPFEFTSDGKYIAGDFMDIGAKYTATADTVTLNVGGGIAIADYTISGTVLTLTQRTSEQKGGFVSGTYYKVKK
jgi:hypothetical protein